MNKFLLFLSLIIVKSLNGQSSAPCTSTESLEVIATSLGSPLTGPFEKCEVITLQYKVDFNQNSSQWIHSIIPTISNCFDQDASLEPVPVIKPQGSAKWDWHPSGTVYWKPEDNTASLIGLHAANGTLCLIGSPDCVALTGGSNCSEEGSSMPAGWIGKTMSTECNSQLPNLSWGDPSKNEFSVTFTVTIPCDACTDLSCNDYTVSIASFSDGQTGGTGNNACNGTDLITRVLEVNCCEQPEMTGQNGIICSNSIYNANIVLDPPGSTITWKVSNTDGINGAADGNGTNISQTLENYTDEDIKVIYEVTPFSPDGCKGDVRMLEVNVLPNLTTNIDDQVYYCKDSTLWIQANPSGGSGDGYYLEWSTGEEDTYGIAYTAHDNATISVNIKDGFGCQGVDEFEIVTFTESVSLPDNTDLIGNKNIYIFNNTLFSVAPFNYGQYYEWSLDGVVLGYGIETYFKIPLISLGSHTLCVRSTNSCDLIGQTICWEVHAVNSPLNADCTGAEFVCSKKEKRITLPGLHGFVTDLEYDNTCNPNGYTEYNSHWMNFEIAAEGKLVFTITPLEEWRDMDFAVYKVVDSMDCYTKVPIRCMWSGGGDCNGATGLDISETDEYEYGGCSDIQNNFLAPLDCKVGDKYYLAVFGGGGLHTFDIEWCGNALMSCDTVPCGPLSSDKINVREKLYVFPNPNSGSFRVELNSPLNGILELYNMSGNRVFYKDVQPEKSSVEIEVGDLPSSVYNLIIRNRKGVIIAQHKIIIKGL